MRKRSIALILMSVLFIQCELFENSYSWRQFTFKNYTENTYSNTTISAGEIAGNKILIHYVKDIGTILPKGTNSFSEDQTAKTEIWDRVFLNFIKNYDDSGCFLIEFSDGRKLFIKVGYYGDFGDELDAANLYEIDITNTEIRTPLKSYNINDIPVEDYEIIR